MTRIGVVLPTRGRSDRLRTSVASLVGLADDPYSLVIAYGVDPDDPDTRERVRTMQLDRHTDITVEFPERLGYSRLHDYVNALSHVLVADARVDWLLLWNDDATMLTGGWDTRIREWDDQDVVLDPHTNHYDEMMLFPIITSRLVMALGHVSLSPHYDTWWEHLCAPLGIRRPVEIRIEHPPIGYNRDETGINSLRGRRPHEFYGPEMTAHRAQDVETLRAFLAGETTLI